MRKTAVSHFPLPALLALIGVLLLAAVLRLWRLEAMPPGLYHDEAYNGLDALSLVQGKTFPQFYEGWELYAQEAHGNNPPDPTRFPIFFEGNYGREPLHIYLMAVSIALFGPTPFAVRLVPALAGVLGVFTTFLAARAVLGAVGEWNTDDGLPNTAVQAYAPVLAAFFLAILFPAVHFSRFGLRAMLFVPVETLAVYFFWRGVNRAGGQGSGGAEERRIAPSVEEMVWFALAGGMLGLGLYVYAAARLFPLLFVGFVLFWFWQDRTALTRFWRSLVVMVGVAFVTAFPLLLFFWRYPYFFVFRIAYVANKGKGVVEGQPWLTWLLNAGRVVRGLFWQGETHLRHNLPGRPYLDVVQSLFFLIGLGGVLRRWRQPRSFFLLLWLVVMLLPTVMSGDAPHFGRMTGAAPVIAIFLAWGTISLWRWGSRRLAALRDTPFHTPWFRPAFLWLLVTLLLISALTLARDYFGRYAGHPDVAADFYLPAWELGQYAAAQTAETALYLAPTQEEMATLYFALADPERLQDFSGVGELVPAGQPGAPALYLIRPSHGETLRRLQAYFPSGETAPKVGNAIPFHMPAAAPRVLTAAQTSHDWGGQIRLRGWTLSRREDRLVVELAWEALAPMERPYTAFVHVLDEAGEPAAQQDRPPAGYPTSDWHPGEIIADTFVVNLSTLPADGQYRVQTGFYYLPTGERLGEAAVLGPLPDAGQEGAE